MLYGIVHNNNVSALKNNLKSFGKSRNGFPIQKKGRTVTAKWRLRPLFEQRCKKSHNTLGHFLKASLGTGILAMPEAFKNSGVILGITSTFLIGVLCTYTIHVLMRAQYEICKKLKVSFLSFPETSKAACELGPNCFKIFAPYAANATNFFHICLQLGLCCIYVLFIGVHFKKIMDQYTITPINLHTYTLCLFIPFVAILFFRSLKILAPLSIMATCASFATFGVICYYVFQNLPVHFKNIPNEVDVKSYALYFGTSLFALHPVNVVITLENNMANPENLRHTFGVLNIGMTIIIFLYIGMGTMGYWRYCLEGVQPSITLNLPENEILGQVIMGLYCISIYISFGLQGYVGIEIIWHEYIETKLEDASIREKLFYEYYLRISVVIFSFALAMIVPLLGLLISFIGSFSLSALGFIFPAMIEMCAFWYDKSRTAKWLLWKDVLLILIGIIGLFCGTFASIYEIVKILKCEKHNNNSVINL